MFKKQILQTALLILGSLSLSAQSVLMGFVQDHKTKEKLLGAVVVSGNQTKITDSEGRFEMQLQAGVIHLKVSYSGYKESNLKLVLEDNTDMSLIIELEESNVLLEAAEVSTSRFEKPVAESPISVDILKPKSAERLNSVSADQILDRVPGVQIIDGQANIRGGSGYSYGAGSRVMLILDDLQILQPDAGFTNWTDLPLENVGQIEIVKGAASALYGSAAMNGVIHFRTIKPSLEPFTSITLNSRFFLKPSNDKEWWGRDQGNGVIPSDIALSFAHRRKLKTFDVVLGGMYRNELSYNKNTGSEYVRLDGSIVKHLSDRLILGLGFNINSGKSSSFFYWDGAGSFVGDTSSFSSSKKVRLNIDPSLQYFTSKNYRHRILTRWLYVDNNNQGNQSNLSNNFFSEYQIQKDYKNIGLTFVSGILANVNKVEAPLYNDTIFINSNLAAYTQLEKKLFHALILSAGVRYEYYKLKGPDYIDGLKVENPVQEDRPVFRFGLNYNVFRGTYLRASYGEGFRFPTLAEKYIRTNAGGFNIIPNSALHSEYGKSTEFGIKQGLKIGAYQGLFDLSYFYSRYQDMMEFTLVVSKDFKFYYQAQNVGNTVIGGFELSNQGIFDFGQSKLVYNAGITFIDPKFQEWDTLGKQIPLNKLSEATKGQLNASASTSYDNVLKYRSKELARIDIEYQYRKFFAGMNFNYASHVEAIDKLFELDLFIRGIKSFRKEHNYGYRVYDFRIGYALKKMEFQVNVQNVFNELYTVRPGLMEAPRSIGGRVVWKI